VNPVLEGSQRMDRELIPVCRPLISEDECAAAARVIRSGWLSTGPEARLFETELSQRLGGYVVGVSSASMGLTLALATHGIGPGDEVIVPAITFAATSHAVLHLGATVVFADVDPGSGLISVDDTLGKVTNKTKAVIPVDLYGQRAPVELLDELAASRHDLVLIEDAAQSFGTPGVTSRPGVTVVFSFYATKNATSGEGGAVVTEDRALAERLRVLSAQGVTADAHARYRGSATYDVVEIGYKANLADVLAAIGRVQLMKEPEMRAMRQQICERYQRELTVETINWNVNSNFHLYPIFVQNREEIRAALHQRGVGTGVHFECVPGHAAYRKMGYHPENTPAAMVYGAEEVTLPTFAGLSEEAQTRVIEAVHEVLAAAPG
jgi:dTDP-4-amino-4,6-dideoxygalactose transaminase